MLNMCEHASIIFLQKLVGFSSLELAELYFSHHGLDTQTLFDMKSFISGILLE